MKNDIFCEPSFPVLFNGFEIQDLGKRPKSRLVVLLLIFELEGICQKRAFVKVRPTQIFAPCLRRGFVEKKERMGENKKDGERQRNTATAKESSKQSEIL